MKVAVIGANGQLGTEAVRSFTRNGDEVYALTHSDIELSNVDSVSSCLDPLRPQIVINTAAMHHVERCEQEPERAFAVNGLGAKNVSLIANELGAILIHVSTDYVFDGKKGSPYEERDAPHPLNAYGITKLAGEHFVATIARKYFILRTSALYGANPCRAKAGLNFIELMLKFARERGEVRVVDDEFVTPTSATELAMQMLALSRCEGYGLYHATAEGSCSWYEFAREIFTLTKTQVSLKRAAPNEFPAKVPRPKYSVLNNRALKNQGSNIFKPWQNGLCEYLTTRVQ